MAAIPFAFSAHHFISSVGADAGFAAIIGLAILVLLFFAQARETASLRQSAAESEEQLRRLAAYVDQLSRSGAGTAPPSTGSATIGAQPRVTAQPRIAAARMGTGAPVASAAVGAVAAQPGSPQTPVGAPFLVPAAPAGVGAPALSAATRLIPFPEVEPAARRAAGPATAAMSVAEAAAVMTAPGPPPSTAAAGANGSAAGGGNRPRVPVAAPVPAGAGTGRVSATGGQPAPRAANRRNEAAAASRPTAASAASVRRPAAQGRRGTRISRGAMAGAAVLVAAIAVAAVLVLNNSGTSSTPQPTSSAAVTTKAPGGRRRAAGTVIPSTVTVAVLNGTSTNNLAHDVLSKLTAVGYKPGASTNASSQTQTTTVVGYLPGHRRAAVAVARSLKLGAASVQAVNPSNQAIACSGSTTTCAAQVVVTVGSDLASLA